jgi:hypothetical protein
MPIERITALVRSASSETFDELALALFRFQYERNAGYRELCDRRGATPEVVADWRDVPTATAPPEASPEPQSEGATAEANRHLHRAVIDRSFAAAGLAGGERPPVLSLIPSGEESSDPGLGILADHVLRARAAPDSLVAAARRGVEAARARSFLGARQRDRRPTLILATTTTLGQLLDALERRGLRFRLPPGSRVVEAGRRGPSGGVPLARLVEGLGVPPEGVVHEYGVEGLVTRFYAGHGQRGEPRGFLPPPWARVRILDPETAGEQPAGAAGAIAIFDLASVGTVAHVLTGETGIAGEGGFRLAANAAATRKSPGT